MEALRDVAVSAVRRDGGGVRAGGGRRGGTEGGADEVAQPRHGHSGRGGRGGYSGVHRTGRQAHGGQGAVGGEHGLVWVWAHGVVKGEGCGGQGLGAPVGVGIGLVYVLIGLCQGAKLGQTAALAHLRLATLILPPFCSAILKPHLQENMGQLHGYQL